MLTADEAMRARFDKAGKRPATVMAITLDEMYFQCAKAVMRSEL